MYKDKADLYFNSISEIHENLNLYKQFNYYIVVVNA